MTNNNKNKSINKIMKVMNPKTYIAKCSLKRGRGWTNKMINDYYPQPAMIVPNPHYRSAAPMKLYKVQRVESIEQTEAFKAYWDKIASKRAKARAMMIERHRTAKAKLIEMEQHTIGMSNHTLLMASPTY